MINRMILVLAVVSIATCGFAQQTASKSNVKALEDAAFARAGCGPDSIHFDVKMDKHQHPLAQPESGKALLYVFEDDFTGSAATTRVGLDGKWIGGNVPLSYMFFSVAPGVHRLCFNWQGEPQAGAALDFTAEADKTYFFHAKMSELGFVLDQAPEAEGHFMIASHGLSTSAEKARNPDE